MDQRGRKANLLNREAWKKVITESCRKAETYKPFFDAAIDTLAGIMERRDGAQKTFDSMGGQTVIEREDGRIVKNPAYITLAECDRDALSYWRDLGLTPAGLRKINEDKLKESGDSLEAVLANIGV